MGLGLDLVHPWAGTDAGAMNSLSAEGLVETLKLLDTPQGAEWLVNAQAFASKIQDCWGKEPLVVVCGVLLVLKSFKRNVGRNRSLVTALNLESRITIST